jgi:hypothetical protein
LSNVESLHADWGAIVASRADKLRHRAGPETETLTLVLPRDLAEAVRAEAHRRGALSVSALVAEILAEKLEPAVRDEVQQRDGLRELLDEIFADQPMTDEERAWADQFLFAP